MKNLNNKLTLSTLCTSLLFGVSAFAEENKEEFHEADPRSTSWRAVVGASHEGNVKVGLGGGGANLFSDEYQMQTNGFLEHYLESGNTRFRGAHFDERFGGVYVDLNHVEDAMNFFTTGYMLPVDAGNGVMLFPSVNYSYIDIDTDGLVNAANSACDFTGAGLNGACSALDGMGGANSAFVKQALGGEDHAQMGTLNLYALKAWNDTHYTVINANVGSSFNGVDMNVANLMWLQGVRAKLGENVVSVFLELKYDVLDIKPAGHTAINNSTFKSEETTATMGFEFKF